MAGKFFCDLIAFTPVTYDKVTVQEHAETQKCEFANFVFGMIVFPLSRTLYLSI